MVSRHFVTICTRNRTEFFGDDRGTSFVLNEYGHIADRCWTEIPRHFSHVSLDVHVIMPNHMHGILFLYDQSVQKEEFSRPVVASLSTIIRSYKSGVTHDVNRAWKQKGTKIWQARFHDHIIESDEELERIREYIRRNPEHWRKEE